jgi:hypothetical protein
MIKIFNKLFEWLGYVPKRMLDFALESEKCLQIRDNWHTMAVDDILHDNVDYYIDELVCSFVIKSVTKDGEDHRVALPVKHIPFGDDKEYAKLCAEELCEKLNERI